MQSVARTKRDGSPRGRHAARRRRGALRIGVLVALALGWIGCGPHPVSPLTAPDTASRAALPAASSLAPSATPEAAPGVGFDADAVVRPPYYRVTGGRGATLLMMGTIHLGPTQGWRFSPEIRAGWREADRFVLEVDPRAAGEAEVSSVLAERVVLPPSTLLEDVVSPETARWLERRDAELAALGLPRNARKRLDPWYLAVGLIEMTTARSDYPMSRSADAAIFAARGDRPLLALETFEEQLAMLDALPPALQDALLRDTLIRLDDAVAELEQLMRAWASNDQRALVAIAYQGADEIPALEDFYERLLGARNRAWLVRLRSWLDDPTLSGETFFVGVGALHLVGPDGLVQLLRDASYRVTPLHPKRIDGGSHP